MGRPKKSARAEAEKEILEKGRFHKLWANDRLHSAEENHHARRRCRQLIEGGVNAVSWDELIGRR